MMMVMSMVALKDGLRRTLNSFHDGGECNMPPPMRQKQNRMLQSATT